MRTRTIYLVRHGQFDHSVEEPDGGGLTELGRQQASSAGRALAQIPVTMVYASTMTRALETAQIINESVHVDIQTSDLLREAIPSIPPRIAPHILMMMHQNPELTHQSIYEDQQRANSAYDTFFIPPPEDEDAYDVLVCHGNIMRYLICKALGVNIDAWAHMEISHCGISIISLNYEGLPRLVAHNQTCHLPRELMTE